MAENTWSSETDDPVAEPEFCSWVFPLSKKSNKNTSSEYRQLKIQAHFLDLTSYSTMN